jgi:hypothetical protein
LFNIWIMKAALRAGLWMCGIGAASVFGAFAAGGQWGPCGPSNIAGLIFMLLSFILLPIGCIVSIVAAIARLFELARNRATLKS